MMNRYKKTGRIVHRLRFFLAMLIALPFFSGAQTIPVPDVLYYKFDGTGNIVPNNATNPPMGTSTATIMGSLYQGSAGQCKTALVGSGLSAFTDYVDTHWAMGLGNSSWTISFWTSGIPSSATLFYLFGDPNAAAFRCFTNGVAGPNNWILRGAGLNDVLVPGAATSAPSLTTFVYDASVNKVFGYYNGVRVVEVPQGTLSLTSTTPTFTVNGYATNVGSAYGALLDEFRVYSRPLSDAEVLTLFERKTSSTVNISSCVIPFTSPSGKYQWYTPGIYKDTIPNSVCGDSAITINLNFYTNNTSITTQPQPATANIGNGTSFSIVAQNATQYQWQVDAGSGFENISDNSNYSGTTTAELSISNLTNAMNGYLYRCVATGNCTPVTSNSAVLHVTSTPAISFGHIDVSTYGDADVELSATSNSGGAISFSSSNTDVVTVTKNPTDNKWYMHFVGAGSATITANQEAFGLYTDGSTSIQHIVHPAQLTITAGIGTKVYGQQDPALTYIATGFKNGDTESIITGSLDRFPGEMVGQFPITPGSIYAGTNYNIGFTSNTFSITPATLTITADAKTKVYGQTDPPLTYSASGFKFGENEMIIFGSLQRNSGEQVGQYTINQHTLTAGMNYVINFTGNNLNITRATLSVNADAKSKVYGDSDPQLTYAASGFKNDDTENVITGSLQRDAGEAVGEYAINQHTLAAGNNYNIEYTSNNLTVTKATLSIAAEAKNKVYGQADPALTYTVTGFKNDDTESIISGNLQRNTGENAGNYAINQHTLSAGDNYDISYTGNQLSVTKATLAVSAEAKTKVYGQEDPELTYNATGFKLNDTKSIMTGALQRVAGENVGNYTINQHTLSAGNNYDVEYTSNTLSITKAAQTISWNQVLSAGCNNGMTIQLNAVSTAGLPVTYTSGNTAVATVDGTTLTALQPGSAVITAYQEGDENHLAATAVVNTFTYSQEGLVKQHFSDALFFVNESNLYVQWQWYKNGTAVAGATRPYYSEATALNGSYYVTVTDNNGNTFSTCPLVLNGNSFTGRKITVSPNPVNAGTVAKVTSNFTNDQLQGARLVITDVLGNVVKQESSVSPVTGMLMPNHRGIYVVTLILANGAKEATNVVVR